ncbi:MAG: hypothetical protein QGF59_15010 [Pirellulaceae bacterium]|nr:hypothetical protein [Pirellulaceae bacterium]MDP6719968.1 hypothetical protein [Pirellulaceae bacterium]
MSASNKSWLMVGGLALVVAGVIYAIKQLNGRSAPPAEIAPATLTSDNSPATRSRTHFPTILRAKPVTEAAPTVSPRYAPRDATLPRSDLVPRDGLVPRDDLQFDKVPVGRYPSPTGLPPSTSPPTTRPPITSPVDRSEVSPSRRDPQAGGAVSPAFSEPTAVDEPSSLPTVSDSESTDVRPAARPTTYVTVAHDSFWNISKLCYGGESRYFKALYFHNRSRILRPDQIPAGIEIETPPPAELLRLYPELCQLGQRN